MCRYIFLEYIEDYIKGLVRGGESSSPHKIKKKKNEGKESQQHGRQSKVETLINLEAAGVVEGIQLVTNSRGKN